MWRLLTCKPKLSAKSLDAEGNTPLHLAAGLHVGAATANFLVSEYPSHFAESPLGPALCRRAPTPQNGSIEVGDEPGLGVELDETRLTELTLAQQTISA